MEKDKESGLNFLFLGIVVVIFIFLLVFLLAGAGGVFLIFSDGSQPADQNLLVQHNNLPDEKVNPLWFRINKESVEENCLAQAKIMAGDFGFAVSSCVCAESVSDSLKSYSCSVSALDGKHSVSVACNKKEETCTIVAEQGSFVFTFEELVSLTS